MPRAGYLTPSSFADLMSNGRGSDTMGKAALAVADRLALDMLGVERPEEKTPTSCQWGLDNEWLAVQTYQERTLCHVKAPNFAVSKTHPYIGGTADGLVGTRGGIEVKCPYSSSEHMENLLCGKQVAQYNYQMQGYMFIYELDWIDFVSFDPRFPDERQLAVYRIKRDDDAIRKIVERCEVAYGMARKKADEVRRREEDIAV